MVEASVVEATVAEASVVEEEAVSHECQLAPAGTAGAVLPRRFDKK